MTFSCPNPSPSVSDATIFDACKSSALAGSSVDAGDSATEGADDHIFLNAAAAMCCTTRRNDVVGAGRDVGGHVFCLPTGRRCHIFTKSLQPLKVLIAGANDAGGCIGLAKMNPGSVPECFVGQTRVFSRYVGKDPMLTEVAMSNSFTHAVSNKGTKV